MRFASRLVRCVHRSVLTLATVAACSSSDDGATDADASVADAAVAADAARRPIVEGSDAGLCTSLVIPPLVGAELVDAGLPEPQGGTIEPGLYHLTRLITTKRFMQSHSVGAAMRFSGSRVESAFRYGDGTEIRGVGKWETNGVELLTPEAECGPRGDDAEFTATAERLEVICQPCGLAYVFERQR